MEEKEPKNVEEDKKEKNKINENKKAESDPNPFHMQ